MNERSETGDTLSDEMVEVTVRADAPTQRPLHGNPGTVTRAQVYKGWAITWEQSFPDLYSKDTVDA